MAKRFQNNLSLSKWNLIKNNIQVSITTDFRTLKITWNAQTQIFLQYNH